MHMPNSLLNEAPHREQHLNSAAMNTPTSRKQLSVLHVVLSLEAGGLERVVIDLARELSAFEQRASILCIDALGVLAPIARAAGINVHCAEKGPGLRWAAVDAIRSVLRAVRPDVVHTHQIGALFYLTQISRELMPVLVHTEHSNQLRRYQTFRAKLRYLTMLLIAGRRADRMFGVSENATRSILRSRLIARSKLYSVPNGIDLSRFQPRAGDNSLRLRMGIPPDSVVLGSVGRLDETKRPDIFLDAFERISGEFPNAHLLFVGDGPLMPALRGLAATLRIADRVHFAGFQQNPEQYLALLDIFVLTSRMEGMPLSVLEAAAVGVPVIASRVGGLEEMSDKGKALLLYDFHDMDALHGGMRKLISDRTFRRQLGQAGREHILGTYSAPKMAFDYNNHYTQLFNSVCKPKLTSISNGCAAEVETTTPARP